MRTGRATYPGVAVFKFPIMLFTFTIFPHVIYRWPIWIGWWLIDTLNPPANADTRSQNEYHIIWDHLPPCLSTAHTLKPLARGKLKFEKFSRWNQSLRIFLESNIWMKWDWWFTYKRSKCRRSKSAFWKEEKSQKWSDCHCNLLPARSSFWQSESGAVVSFVVELIIKKYQMYNGP